LLIGVGSSELQGAAFIVSQYLNLAIQYVSNPLNATIDVAAHDHARLLSIGHSETVIKLHDLNDLWSTDAVA
jgi:hypothetical protein